MSRGVRMGLAVLMLAATTVCGAAPYLCAVLPLSATNGCAPADAADFRARLSAELRGTGRFSTLKDGDVDRVSASAAGPLAAGRALGVPFLVAGRLSGTGAQASVRLEFFDVYGAEPERPLLTHEMMGAMPSLREPGAGAAARRFADAIHAPRRSAGRGNPDVRVLYLGGDVQLELVRIPAGEFIMGASDGDADETPHPVRLTHDLWMSRDEITNQQFERFLADSGYQGAAEADKDYLKHFEAGVRYASRDGGYPVVCVSWFNAKAFCDWLSRRAGCTVRLPTEAEWEYACRAGTRTRYFTGDSDAALLRAGWFAENSDRTTHPVGRLEPNAWGLRDMHGNVWEWCEDWYGETYYASSPPADPPGPNSGATRVLRGGSWFLISRYCRSANRSFGDPRDTNYVIGFRIAVL